MEIYSKINNTGLDLNAAKESVVSILLERGRVLSTFDIQKKVSDYFNLKVSDLKSPARSRNISFPRQVAYRAAPISVSLAEGHMAARGTVKATAGG